MADQPPNNTPPGMDPADFSTGPVDVAAATAQFIAAAGKHVNTDVLRDTVVAGVTQSKGAIIAAGFKWITAIATQLGIGLENVESVALPVLAGFTTPMVAGMFDTEVDPSAFADRANGGARNAAAGAMVDAFIAAITNGASEPAEPTDAGAKALAAASLRAALEGWFMASLPELLSDLIPFEVGHFEAFTKLPEDIIRALGVGRLVRRAFTPLVNATATVPMTWYANKKYRPTKLGAATVVRQLARGHWNYDQAYEELAREGYKDVDIEALINEASKFLSVAELDLLVQIGSLDRGAATQHLQDAGWTEETAGTLLDLERFKRIAHFELQMADAAITAYADGRIDESTLDTYTHGVTIEQQHGAELRELAAARHALRIKGLSPSEAEQCVLAHIIPIVDYEHALTRAGYSPDAIDALELLLRTKIDAKTTAAEHRTQMLADRAAAQKKKADDAAAKQAAIEATRALRRQGSIAELEHAVIVGLIPIARLEQVLRIDYDPDTVQIYVADVEAKRAAYVAREAKAAKAATSAATKGLSIGELTAAVLDNVLTVDQVRAHLLRNGLDPADVDVLVQTLAAKKADHDAAVAKRARADAAAKTKGIDLARMEALVLLGARTPADYDQLLASLGYDVASRAAMVQLLELKVQKAATAATTRKGISAASATKGLSLTQFRRAVIAGAKTLDEFQTWLVQQGYTSDAVSTLSTELGDDVAAADAARTRRTATSSVADTHALPLSALTRAARLGVITPGAYADELTARGYSSDDVALELSLLSSEIATAQGARKALPTTAAGVTSKGLTLGEIAALVKGGHATVGDYQARALALGYSSDDAAALAALLTDELATLAATTKRHVQISGELAARSLSLAEVEAAVKDGSKSLDDYAQWLTNNGYGAADAALLRALLDAKLAAAAAKAGGPAHP